MKKAKDVTANDGIFQRIISGCVSFMQKYLPEPFIFAIILTFVAIAVAIPVCKQSITEVVSNWGSGVWNLLGFSMQMALVLVTGATLAAAPVIKKVSTNSLRCRKHRQVL